MRFLRRAIASPSFVSGALLLTVVVLAAALAPALSTHSPTEQDLTSGLLAPSAAHPFGTDQLGRDVLARVLFAARVDLGIAAVAAIAPFVIGVTLGLVSGYFGRATDWVISRITDTVIAFPFYVLVIALVFAIGAGPRGIIVAFAVVGWVGYARVMRSLAASMRQQGWVRAARGAGLSDARVLVRHVLPNVLPQAIVLLASEIVLIMVAIVTLGFLGLGVRPPTPDWGTMISDGQPFVTSHWWLSVLPGLAVVVTGIALALLGDGLGDALRVRDTPRVARARRRAAGAGPVTRAAVRGAAGGGGRDAGATAAGSTAAADADAGNGAAQPDLAPGAVRVRGLVLEAVVGDAGALVGAEAAPGGPAGISLDVAPGEALGIVGESGSGKSLTLRAVAGLLPRGVRATAGTAAAGGRIGMVFQDPLAALDPLARVGSQLGEACRAAGAADPAARVRELLGEVRLPDVDRIARSYPHELSGGQRQRVVIAMALAGNPAVLLADEPTTALDVTVQREVLDLLARLRRERGITLVLVSHDLAVVSTVCERVAVMRLGRILERGDTARVLTAPEHPYTAELLAAVPDPPGEWTGADRGRALAASGEAADPVLTLSDAAVRYGGRDTVSGVTFAVRGSLGLVGESGSGKTTIARAIAGELPLSAGSIAFEGRTLSPRRRSRALRTAIQLIPQDPASSLNPRRTAGAAIGEVLRVAAGVPRAEIATRVASLLAEVGLGPELARAYPHELSGGQRQRVAIARALAAGPRLLIADEATSALDVSVQAEVIALLKRLREERGLALLVISHDLAVVHELCDDVVVLRGGRVVERGARVLVEPNEPYTRELIAAIPRLPGSDRG